MNGYQSLDDLNFASEEPKPFHNDSSQAGRSAKRGSKLAGYRFMPLKISSAIRGMDDSNMNQATMNNTSSSSIRRHWMSDAACKKCMNCQTSFNVFKRKHHCRSCGAIYCDKCSSRTVAVIGFEEPVRVCDNCHLGIVNAREGSQSHGIFFLNSDHSGQNPSLVSSTKTGDRLVLAKIRSNAEQSTTGGKNVNNSDNSGELSRTKVNDSRSSTARKQNFAHQPMELADSVAQLDIDGQPQPRYVTLANAVAKGDGLSKRGNSLNPTEGLRADQLSLNDSIYESRGRIRRRSWPALFPKDSWKCVPFNDADMLEAMNTEADLFRKMCNPPNQQGFWSIHVQILENNRRQILDRFLTRRLHELGTLKPCKILFPKDFASWKEKLHVLIEQFCGFASPSQVNLRQFFKSDILPGGSIEDSTVLNGFVSEKNVVDRTMRQKISNPRLLLVSETIEFIRDNKKISSLDTLREQEQQYLDLAVRNISALGVDLLLVGAGVSRTAQSLLGKAGISLVINIPQRDLERIARLTGAVILPTVGSILEQDDVHGTCDSWYIRDYPLQLGGEKNREAIFPATGRSSSVVGKAFRSFMFFEGTPYREGANVFLRGGCLETLETIESILFDAINLNYTILQRNSLLHDLGAVFSFTDFSSPISKSLDDMYFTSESFSFVKTTLRASESMNESKTISHRFGDVGSELSLGRFLRKQCFLSGSDNCTKVSTNSTNASQDLKSRVAPETTSSIGKGTDTSTELNNLRPTGDGSTRETAKTKTTLTAFGMFASSSLTGLKQEGETKIELSPPEVYSAGDGRVYLLADSLLNIPNGDGVLMKTALLNFRREYVSLCIRNLQRSSTTGSSSFPTIIQEHVILSWAECSKCKAYTDFRVLTKDSESFSVYRWFQLMFCCQAKSSSLFFPSLGSPRCKHRFLQDYTIYFELMGRIASFRFERAHRVATSLYVGSYSLARPLDDFPNCWRSQYIKSKKEDIEKLLFQLEKMFLREKLLRYSREYNGNNEKVDLLVLKMIEKIESSLKFNEEIAARKMEPLELCHAELELFRLAESWNKELEGLVQLSASDMNAQTVHEPAMESNPHEISAKPVEFEETRPNSAGAPEEDVDDEAEKQETLDIFKLFEPVCLSETSFEQEHPHLPFGFGNRVVYVYDAEPTSWIAHALNSKAHRRIVFNMADSMGLLEEFQCSDWSKILSTQSDPSYSSRLMEFNELPAPSSSEFRFYVQAFYPLQFYSLRQAFLQRKTSTGRLLDAEIGFIESLSRCSSWKATGGKSRSTFFKSLDGRFIAKSISAEERDMFLSTAPGYFSYLGRMYSTNTPSAMQRVVGVYTITCKKLPFQTSTSKKLSAATTISNSKPTNVGATDIDSKVMKGEKIGARRPENSSTIQETSRAVAVETTSGASESIALNTEALNKGQKVHYIVLENLFPSENESMTRFDLKGNLRNRLVTNPNPGDVLMDQNFCKFTGCIPIPFHEYAKNIISAAIDSDTKFFESEGIVDYSMLIGIPCKYTQPSKGEEGRIRIGPGEDNATIRVGIIDFCQQYNMKKMIESRVKRAGMIAGHSEPTVVDPTNYRTRMLRAVHRYFMAVPDNSISSTISKRKRLHPHSYDDLDLL